MSCTGSAPADRYVKASDWADDLTDRHAIEEMARAVSEVATKSRVRFVAVDINSDEGPAAVATPNLAISTDVVERALKDAEHLISATGATSGVDRVHTALHGYVKAVCDEAGIRYPPDVTVTRAFKLLREQHSAFANLGTRGEEIQRIVQGFASAIDAFKHDTKSGERGSRQRDIT